MLTKTLAAETKHDIVILHPCLVTLHFQAVLVLVHYMFHLQKGKHELNEKKLNWADLRQNCI